jgi:serine/threonine protein kinase
VPAPDLLRSQRTRALDPVSLPRLPGDILDHLPHPRPREPDPTLLPRTTPSALRALVARCLARDPKRRLQAIGDARIELEEIAARPEPESPMTPRRSGASPLALAGATAAGIAAAVGVLALGGWLGGEESRSAATRDGGTTQRVEIVGLSVVNASNVAISPDGSEVLGYDTTPSRPGLLRRSLDSFELRRIPIWGARRL